MKLHSFSFIIVLICLQIKLSFEQEALEVNTDYAEYKELKENQELELTCKNNVDNTQAVTWTPPSIVPHEAYSLDIKDGNVFTLTIKNAKREYTGKYTCKSHTRNGDQLTKDIHVGVIPKIKTFLINGIETKNGEESPVCESEKEVKLECSDDKFTYPKSVIEWKINDVKLEDEESKQLTIQGGGNYSCKLSNSIGSTDWKVPVSFIDKTNGLKVNTDYEDYKELHEGQKLELTCKNLCDPSQNVTCTTPNNVPNDTYTMEMNVYTFTIKNATREYAGKYTFKSHTRNGDQLNKDVHVGIKPKIVKFSVNGTEAKDKEQFEFHILKTVKLECFDDTKTYPISILQWRKNDAILEDEGSNSLEIKEDGTYACELANSIGSMKLRVNIRFNTSTTTGTTSTTKTKLRKLSEEEHEYGISTGCIVGTIFLGIIIVILLIYLINFYIYVGLIKNKEKTKIMLKEIILLVILLVSLIFLIITQLINKCGELTWICIIETVISILLIPLFALDLYYQSKEQQSLLDKFCKKIGFNKTTSQEQPKSGNRIYNPPNQESSISLRITKGEVSQSEDENMSFLVQQRPQKSSN